MTPANRQLPIMNASDIKFARLLVFVNAVVPLALLLWDWYHAELGANPLEPVAKLKVFTSAMLENSGVAVMRT